MKELTCPNCPGVISGTAREAANNLKSQGHLSKLFIECPTCHAHLLVTIDWQPVPVAVVLEEGDNEQ